MNGYSAGEPVITAWAVASPFGLGRAAFAEGLRAGRSTDVEVAGLGWDLPDERACLVPGFQVSDLKGRKGIRAMDRITGLALATVGDLLEQLGPDSGVADRDDTGIVFGTSAGSTQTMMDFTRASFTGKRPYHVDPAMMPYGVMNATAGQCAIWHQLRGPNTTLAAGRAGALFGLRYARRLFARDRAARVLVGCAEDYSRSRAWLWQRSNDGPTTLLGEGALVMLVEPAGKVGAGRRPLARVLAVESRTLLDDDPAAALGACVLAALKSANLTAQDVQMVSVSDAPGALGAGERAAVADVLGDRVTVLPGLRALMGETGSASSAFQIGALLAAPRPAGRQVALVTSVDRDGIVVCALLGLGDDVDVADDA